MKTTQEIQTEAELLAEELKTEVTPVCYNVKGVQHVGYIKRPDFYVKSAAFDKIITSPSGAGEIIFDNCLIKEHSSAAFFTDDDLKYSAIQECIKMINGYSNEMAAKKK